MTIQILPATELHWEGIWEVFQEVVARGDTYAYLPSTTREEARQIWLESPRATYVALDGEEILGTYYIKGIHPGLGAHVCNCGYMVKASARGRGIATSMCQHSQTEAVKLGFKAMQFNLVAVTNQGAVRLWEKLGYEIIGTLPKAFYHQQREYVDALVMYKWLGLLPSDPDPDPDPA